MIYIYSVPKTHPFLVNLFRKGVTVYLPLPSCELLLLHAYGRLSKTQLLAKLGLSEGFYARSSRLIAMLPYVAKLYQVRCFLSLETAQARDRAYYEAAKAAYLLIFSKASPQPPSFPVPEPPEGGPSDVVVVDNYVDYFAWKRRGDWAYLATPRPGPVEKFLIYGVLDIDEYLKTSIKARRHEEAFFN